MHCWLRNHTLINRTLLYRNLLICTLLEQRVLNHFQESAKTNSTEQESNTVETVYKVDVCPRYNLPYFWIYPITGFPTVYKVSICPRGYLPYIRIYPTTATGYPFNGFYCTVMIPLSNCQFTVQKMSFTQRAKKMGDAAPPSGCD